MFTPEELAEMARADAEIEVSFRWTNEELERSRAIDRDVVVGRMDNAERKKAAQRKAYREANRDKVAEYQKAYYEANRDKVAEYQKAYREANRDKVAAQRKAIADARKVHKWTQAELAQRLGISRSLVSQWETGMVQANWELLFEVLPELKETDKKRAARRGGALTGGRSSASAEKTHSHYRETERKMSR